MKALKVGQLVKFNIIQDDSDYASNCFGVEPENDWFDIQIYVEQVYGEVVKKNTIQIINKSGTKLKNTYKVINGVILSELSKLNYIKWRHDLKLYQIFEDSGLKTLNDFKKIQYIDYIELNKTYAKYPCLESLPNIPIPLSIWENCNIGYKYVGESFYKDGFWHDSDTDKINNNINSSHYWEVSMNKIYMNGKIFIESPEVKPLVKL